MGHGHVKPNKDGSLARCGGPAICSVCAIELANASKPVETVDNYTLKPGPIVQQDIVDMMVNEYEGGCGEQHLYEMLCELAHSHTTLQKKWSESEAELGRWTGGETLRMFQKKELEQRIRAENAERLLCALRKRLSDAEELYRERLSSEADLRHRGQKLVKALKLTLYYVDGDAAYDGLVQQIKERFEIDINQLSDKAEE